MVEININKEREITDYISVTLNVCFIIFFVMFMNSEFLLIRFPFMNKTATRLSSIFTILMFAEMIRNIIKRYNDVPCEFLNAGIYTLIGLIGYFLFYLFKLIPPVGRGLDMLFISYPIIYGLIMSIFISSPLAGWELIREKVYYKKCVSC